MASPWHLQLTTALYNKVPRELRDEIYGHAWAAEALPASFHESPYTHDTPRILQVACHEVAVEAAQWYYEHESHFTVRAPEKLNIFLLRDVFQVGLAPKDCALKKLIVHINIQHVLHYLEKNLLLPQFQLLPALNLKHGFELELEIKEGIGEKSNMSAVELQRIGGVLKPVLDAIEAKGASVKVGYVPKQGGAAIDITKAFGGTISTWMKFLGELLTMPRAFEQYPAADVGTAGWLMNMAKFHQMEQKTVQVDISMAKIKLMLQQVRLESGREF